MEEAAIDKPADAWYTGHNQDNNDQYYASNYDGEAFVNFHGIESVCSIYHQSFLFRSLLHKHLKAACLPGNLSHSQARTSLPTSLPIQISKSTLDSIGSDLTFRSGIYATASVTFSSHAVLLQSDLVASCCLDTGCGMTLVNRE